MPPTESLPPGEYYILRPREAGCQNISDIACWDGKKWFKWDHRAWINTGVVWVGRRMA